MKHTFKVLGIIALALVIGFAMIACDNSTSPSGPYDGTWAKAGGVYRLIVSGDSYTFRGFDSGSWWTLSVGTYDADLSIGSGSFTIYQTQSINMSTGQLVSEPETGNGKFTLIEGTLTLYDFTSPFSDVNGDWTR